MPGYFDGGYFDPGYFDTGSEPATSFGFLLLRNGTPEDVLWGKGQFAALRLGKAAFDGTVGMGSITVPGIPQNMGGTWKVGDRITFKNLAGDKIIYTGYLHDPVVERNPDAKTEVQTIWQLQDINRQLIGRRVTDQTWPLAYSPHELVLSIPALIDTGSPNPSIDDTTWVDDGVDDNLDIFTDVPKIYTADGATAWIGDLVKYTGKTVYLGLTDSENEFDLHYHALTTGPTATITIDDTIGDDPPANTFAPGDPRVAFSTTDLKDGITFDNGVESVGSSPIGTYAAGGLGFEGRLQYEASADALGYISDSLITTGLQLKPTFTMKIGPLTTDQVWGIPAGSIVSVTSEVQGLITTPKRVSAMAVTPYKDAQGTPLPGLWDVELECDFPVRSPVVVPGFGGQYGTLGADIHPNSWNDTKVSEDDPGIPVGSTETVTAQLIDNRTGEYIAIPAVPITWTVYEDDKTTVHPDYSTLDDDSNPASTSLTDVTGQAHIIVKRDADTIGANHVVKADPP